MEPHGAMDTQNGAVEGLYPVVADSYHFDSSYDPILRPFTHCIRYVYAIPKLLIHTGKGGGGANQREGLEGQ
jgi:hypothetical protein